MVIIILLIVIVIVVYAFMQQSMFGKIPTGERLDRIKQSANYKDGKFQNQSHTPDLTEGTSYYAVLKEFIFHKSKRSKPTTIFSIVLNCVSMFIPGK